MKRRGEKGAALLLVILLVALLTLLVVEFQREAWVHGRSAESLRDDLQAHAVLRSGAQLSSQILAVYANPKNTFAAMQAGLETSTDAQVFWDLFFSDDWVTIPVPVGSDEPYVPLSARLLDLLGKFPVGAIEVDPATALVRLQAFRDYLSGLKEYLSSRENTALDELDPEAFAGDVSEMLKAAPNSKAPLRDLSDLLELDEVTPDVLNALAPYLDTRTDWKFSVNGMTVPMIMAMTGKSVEEAQDIRAGLQETPVDDAQQIANGPLSARDKTLYPDAVLLNKSQGFELFLEADVRGVLRRVRAVYRSGKGAEASGSGSEGEGKFRLESWVEGWVAGWPGRSTIEPKPASPPPGPSKENP